MNVNLTDKEIEFIQYSIDLEHWEADTEADKELLRNLQSKLTESEVTE